MKKPHESRGKVVFINPEWFTSINCAGFGIFRYTLDGIVRYIDKGTRTIFDLEHREGNELIGKKISDLIKDMFPSGFLQAYNHHPQPIRNFECRIKTLKDRVKWIAYDSYVVVNTETDEEEIQVILRDISDLKNTERELVESKQQLDAVIRTVPDIVYRLDAEGKITFINAAVERYGYKANELIGKSIFDLIHPNDRSRATYRVNERRTGKRRTQSLEIRLLANLVKDEVVRKQKKKDKNHFLVTAEGLYASSEPKANSFMGTQGIARDVTKRRRVIQTLHRRDAILKAVGIVAEQLLRNSSWRSLIDDILAVLGNATEATRLYLYENTTNDNQNIIANLQYQWTNPKQHIDDQENNFLIDTSIDWNSEIYSRWSRFLGERCLVYGPVKKFPEIEKNYLRQQHIRSIVCVPIFVREKWWGFLRFDQCARGKKWSFPECEALRTAANILGSAISRELDDQERKSLEEELWRAQKIEAIGRMAGGISHDFNNLLTCMIGNMLLTEQKVPSELRKYITNTRVAAERAAELVRQLMMFSQKNGLESKPVQLNDLIQKLYQLTFEHTEHRFDVRLNLKEDLPEMLGDVIQLKSMLMDLFVNAREAVWARYKEENEETPKKQYMIRIDTKVEHITAAQAKVKLNAYKGDFVVLRIQDNGTGMDIRTRERVFEPYFSTKEVGEGSGLGLPSVYGIVKQHKGWIEFDSNRKDGTTFKIYFPVAGDISETMEASKRQGLAGTEKILFIGNDSSENLDIIQDLKNFGYSVVQIRDDQHSLDYYKKEFDFVDIVIFDWDITSMDAIEIFKKIKDNNALKKMIIYSWKSSYIKEKYLKDDKNIIVINKPIHSHNVIREIRAMLQIPSSKIKPLDNAG